MAELLKMKRDELELYQKEMANKLGVPKRLVQPGRIDENYLHRRWLSASDRYLVMTPTFFRTSS